MEGSPPEALPTENSINHVPPETLVTLDVKDQELSVLLERIIQEAAVLNHPAVNQVNPIPDIDIA